MSFGRFLGGILVGGALGAIVGVLIAPRRGEETREIIREEFSGRLNRSLDEVKSRGNEAREKALYTADQLRARGEEIAAELEEAGRDAWDKIKSGVKVGKSTEISDN